MDAWVPAQYKEGEAVELRGLVSQRPKGYKERNKRKLEDMEALQDCQEAASRMDDGGADEAAQPSSKRQKAEGGLGYIPVSGRIWKVPGRRAGEVMKPKVGTSWEQKMEQRATRKQFQELKQEAAAAFKGKRKAAAKQKKEALELKAANRAKSEVVQKISNPATIKKMMKSKKQKKLLRTADTN